MTDMLRRRYTVHLTIDVQIGAVPRPDSLPPSAGLERAVAAQQRLLDAVLSRPEVREPFLRGLALEHARYGLDGDVQAVMADIRGSEQSEDDVLWRMVATLPEEERRFFERAEARDLFLENTQDLYEAIATQTVAVSLQEVAAPALPRAS